MLSTENIREEVLDYQYGLDYFVLLQKIEKGSDVAVKCYEEMIQCSQKELKLLQLVVGFFKLTEGQVLVI